ncbi:MAG: PIN domain-containing protein [bacterium]
MTSKSELVVDANVVLEVLAKRENLSFCLEVWDRFDNLFLAPTSLHIIYYFGKKYGFERLDIDLLLEGFKILDFTEKDYRVAKKICVKNDFEDALQIATSLGNHKGLFFTLDQGLKKGYSKMINFA